MTRNDLNFTVADGLRVQAEQLSRWATVLKPAVFQHVEKIAKANNDKATSGFDIFRGTDIDQVVQDIAYNSVELEGTETGFTDEETPILDSFEECRRREREDFADIVYKDEKERLNDEVYSREDDPGYCKICGGPNH